MLQGLREKGDGGRASCGCGGRLLAGRGRRAGGGGVRAVWRVGRLLCASGTRLGESLTAWRRSGVGRRGEPRCVAGGRRTCRVVAGRAGSRAGFGRRGLAALENEAGRALRGIGPAGIGQERAVSPARPAPTAARRPEPHPRPPAPFCQADPAPFSRAVKRRGGSGADGGARSAHAAAAFSGAVSVTCFIRAVTLPPDASMRTPASSSCRRPSMSANDGVAFWRYQGEQRRTRATSS